MNDRKKTAAELLTELHEAKRREAREREERKNAFEVKFRYDIRPHTRNAMFDKIYDPTCVLYRLGRTCLNKDDAYEVGYQDHELAPNGSSYLFNTVTHKIICAIGGGTIFITQRWDAKENDGADDRAFEKIGRFLESSPEGGDITDIVQEYHSQRGQLKRS